MEIQRLVVGALQTNCYLIDREERGDAVVIDPGGDADAILSALGRRTAAAVLLTHAHFDHTAALGAFPGVPVYLHAGDGAMVSDSRLNAGQAYGDTAPRAGDFRYIAESDVIGAAGLSFEVWHTPGHTPGGVCYKIGDCLFTGDTLFRRGYGRTDFALGSFPALMQSLRRLLKHRENLTIYPGHGDETTLDEERGRT